MVGGEDEEERQGRDEDPEGALEEEAGDDERECEREEDHGARREGGFVWDGAECVDGDELELRGGGEEEHLEGDDEEVGDGVGGGEEAVEPCGGGRDEGDGGGEGGEGEEAEHCEEEGRGGGAGEHARVREACVGEECVCGPECGRDGRECGEWCGDEEGGEACGDGDE